ncbi:unannotated protein [freshwater metagenome]|uniref:Unannotated protein n=1 Tax=freshwater metagenome TaxID=449393 RepID=A0A6J6B706_9ZZZZ
MAAAFERERPEDFFGASFDSAGAEVSAAELSLLDLAALAGVFLAAGFAAVLAAGAVASVFSLAFARERVGLDSGALVASRLVFFSTI